MLDVQGVTGSSPVSSTTYFEFYGPVVQLVRTPACHAGGRGFESLPDRHLLLWKNTKDFLMDKAFFEEGCEGVYKEIHD